MPVSHVDHNKIIARMADHRQQQEMGAESLFGGEQQPSLNGHHLVSRFKIFGASQFKKGRLL